MNPDEDHREYPVTEAEYEQACAFLSDVDGLHKMLVSYAREGLEALQVKPSDKDWNSFVATLSENIGDLLHKEVKEAQEKTGDYVDPFRAQVQSYYNSTRL